MVVGAVASLALTFKTCARQRKRGGEVAGAVVGEWEAETKTYTQTKKGRVVYKWGYLHPSEGSARMHILFEAVRPLG